MGEASSVSPRRGDTEVLPAVSVGREPVQIGPYRILGVVARGGMGSVYRAQVVVSCEVPMGREVAIKLLRSLDSREERLRFAREAGYLQVLRHPGIVRVLDAGEYEGQPYLVMPLIEGRTLQRMLIENGTLGEQETAEIAIQGLEALHTAHLAGILHRDVKPGNIMLAPDGGVKLLDFGLAHRLDSHSTLTATGAVVGTPAYMSPEQACGDRMEVGRRSDLYSLGACMYEMLTGHQPFTAENSVALLRMIIDQPLLPPSRLRPGISQEMETVVLKAMARYPGDRYATAEQMAEDLRRFRQGRRVLGRLPGAIRLGLRTAWQHRRMVAALGLMIFFAVSLIALSARALIRDRAKAEILDPDPNLVGTEWVDELARPGGPEGDAGLSWRSYSPIGKGADLATLPPIDGPVRLRVEAILGNGPLLLALMTRDRDLGQGYQLRLSGDPESVTTLALLREDKVVASQAVPTPLPGSTIHLRLECSEDTVVGEVTGQPSLVFVDLAPIEGPDANGVHLARDPEGARIGSVRLERQRTGLLVSALAPADLLRQDGRYARAIQGYEAFLRDNPDSPLARDARFRIGLCQEALHDDERALEAYIEVARRYRDHPHHALAATFRAWGCSLRLGHYVEAEQYFEAIRRAHDLPSLLASVAEETIDTLVADYLGRASALAAVEPDRAINLDNTAADLAGYLGRVDQSRQARLAAVELMLAGGSYDLAAATLDRLIANADVSVVWDLRLRLVHVDRLRGRHELAIGSLRHLIDAAPPSVGQWSRFWLGDLFVDLGDRNRARETWDSSLENESLPGRLMRHLSHGTRPLSLPDEDPTMVEYANARLALLLGLDQQYIDRLNNVLRLAPAHQWPVPLARRLSE